jgi:hypothetical protein
MAFFEKTDLRDLYSQAKSEAYEWRKNYEEYERLADNGLAEDIDKSLPEVNDGTLAAALFKLPKRIVNKELVGRFKAMDADEAWVSELANIYWENKIVPGANYKAPWGRKWKDAVRKAAIYGSQPIISLLVDDGNGGVKPDIDVPYVQDVRLEPGKVSDQDSDIIFWDVYYTRKQVKDLIEQAKREQEEQPTDGYNKWDIEALQAIYDTKQTGEDRDANEEHNDKKDRSVTKGGVKFCISFQRGVKAPFYMYHHSTDKAVREWENPDPTGDIPVKFLYCYQDFNNPYGIGIVKLAGGTQNVLDELRRLHVLATQIGIRPPLKIEGNEDEVDFDSLIYAQEQPWITGNARVSEVNMANGVYQQLQATVSMYKTSLLDVIPTGDTSISGTDSGNPSYSKTPAGVKMQASNLSIDDEDFKDNLYMTYEAVAENLINITFANMQGADLMRLSDDEMKILASGGLEIPMDELGQPMTNELEILWDDARATFKFEMEADDSKAAEEAEKIESMVKALELRAADPNFDMSMQMSGYKFNLGEAYFTLMKLITKNDKIVEEISAEEKMQVEEQMAMQAEAEQMGGMEQPEPLSDEEAQANIEAVMAEYGVDQQTAAEALMLEEEGEDPEAVKQAIMDKQADMEMQDAA